jgi:phage terminase large subunit-like protein
VNYSIEQIAEVMKCSEDVEYFADNYIKFSNPNGVVLAKLNDFQRSVISNYRDNKVFFMPAGRQEGKSTVAAIILLHQALFTEQRVSLVFARTKSQSSSIIEIVTEMYERLPEFFSMCSKMTARSKSKVEFGNGCSIISAGSDINYGRGRAISTIYIDESEWFDKLEDVLTSLYPCMAAIPYSKLFALSSTFTGDSFRRLRVT